MSARARPVQTPVELPNPEAAPQTDVLDPAEPPHDDLTEEMEEAEEEQIEGETQEVPVTPPQKQPDAQVAGAPPGMLAPKQDSTTVRIDSSLVPRLPSDFLESGNVQVDGEEEEFEFDDGELTEESAGAGGGAFTSAQTPWVCAHLPKPFGPPTPPRGVKVEKSPPAGIRTQDLRNASPMCYPLHYVGVYQYWGKWTTTIVVY